MASLENMKTIFDKITRDNLISRIKTLNENSAAEWGKMNIYQMLKHCTLAEEMYLGKKKYKRVFLGRLLGKMALKNLLKDERPMSRNAPTSPAFKVSETNGDILAEKKKWIALIEEYAHYSNSDFTHWFFGKMTKEQIGYFVYKHTDHHLRQFNG
jgi:hypothetical protein